MLSVKTIDDKNSVLITCGLTTKSQSGSKPYIPNNAVYIFDFITNTYTLHSKLSSARVSHQSAAIGGSVCLFGGIRNKKNCPITRSYQSVLSLQFRQCTTEEKILECARLPGVFLWPEELAGRWKFTQIVKFTAQSAAKGLK